MINILLGLGLAIYGIFRVVQANLDPTIDTTITWWLQNGGAILAGGSIAAWNAIPLVSGLIANFKSSPTKKEEIVNTIITEEMPDGIKIKSEEEADMSALYYLTERCKKTGNGLELCKQLNDLFFSIHHPAKEDKVG